MPEEISARQVCQETLHVKYLVLGASSFYGSNFCNLLRERGEEVEELSRPKWHLGHWIPYADCVVNFASQSLVAESWDYPIGWLHANATMTTELLDKVRTLKIPRFVHVSTPEVYGNTAKAVKEGYPFNPSTPYAVSRAAGDMMISAYHRAYGFPAIITRTANIYGAGQPDHRFIPHAFKTLRAGGNLGLHGGGATIRGFIHVRDACEATYLLCREGALGETYHIAPRSVVTIEALSRLIHARVGKGVISSTPERLGKDMAYILDSTKIRALAWDDKITLSEGLDGYGNTGD